jgi:glycosyltransferase involved in cell wall biosynthesis
MHISVILTTYNQPAFLEKVLWGWALQTRHDFQLVIADDGSGPETLDVIRRVCAESGLTALHVWHEDRGFRKTEILNRAIAACDGDYLLFTDGDTIPRRDLVDVHYRLAEPGRYLAGGYIKMPREVSEAITVDEVRSGRFADLAWLRARGWKPGHRAFRLTRSPRLARLYDALTPTKTIFAGNNSSVWRDAVVAANGFEGEMGYGGLDRALGYRLVNLGLRGKQIRHRAIAIHLHHERPYRTPEGMRRNREILDAIRRGGETRARLGLAELQPDPSLRVRGEPLPQEIA